MTTTLTVKANKSSQFARSDTGVELGGGQDNHLPVGSFSGYRYRAGVNFPEPAWPASGEIVAATLRLKTTGYVHVTKGGHRGMRIRRITSSWSANSAEQDSGVLTANPTKYPGPSATAAGDNDVIVTNSNNTYDEFSVLAMVKAMAPTALGGDNAAWQGFLLTPEDEDDTSETVEFYSSKASSGDRPELVVEIELAAPPDAPVLVDPVGDPANAANLILTYTHPDGLEANAYDIEVDEWVGSPGTSMWVVVAGTTGIVTATNTITRAYGGLALVDGTEYSWRARVRDTAGTYGPWSAYTLFTPQPGAPVSDPWSRWASTILAALADPAPITALGLLRPKGPLEVLPIVTAEFGQRWNVVHDHVTPTVDIDVRVIGMRCTLKPSGLEVSATTEDVS